MLSVARIAAVRASSAAFPAATKARCAYPIVRWMTIEAELEKKERVEEERYIRMKEQEAAEKLKKEEMAAEIKAAAEAAAAAKAEEEAIFSATMDEAASVLVKTSDKISSQGLENLARW
eukprot:CAMPEP_0172485772 /NCGR_PEP_ID=MMETSP1066-20121228/13953_1 /TAXON_ID=671091 /ORGANISM="Coscinodiscus wailesii, Strain CCMP2513" /LENGTH=118 /DNA_ID=CAMNT_0013251233 /DNA_START=124 /DNA_END=477 /DNA_ORIENTATION=-